ncbi:hypothetical protein [Larkinella rosea]|uniref:Uncharacterized protein n=1 Tax=Larkinella rosea TaxID=2025312 RepID=A0A3P1BP90_9BACT|nr:hypothetical protein [Larkinella rosea]RRB02881.1 hypothetical protein EHT25_20810 [Larkinella rosea]
MQKGIIKLGYRKIIDASTHNAWDQFVFNDTHLEFYMQAQRLDPAGKFPTFRLLKEHVAGADQLHYLTSTAAIGYIRQLNDLIPDVANRFGKRCLPFQQFRFEIIDSHIQDKSQHKISIWFYSDPVTWIDTVENNLLIACGDKTAELPTGDELQTDLIPLSPFLSITHFSPSERSIKP